MSGHRSFSHMQLSVAAILGSPISVAILSAVNVWRQSRRLATSFLCVFFATFIAAHLLIRTDSVAVGLVVFLLFVLSAMGFNYVYGSQQGSQERFSWVLVLFVSVLSSISYVALFALTE